MGMLLEIALKILHAPVFNHEVWEWAAAGLCALAGLAAGRLALRLNSRIMQSKVRKTASRYDDIFFAALGKPLTCAIMLAGVWLGTRVMRLSPDAAAQAGRVCSALLALCAAWFASKVCNGFFAEKARANRGAMHALQRTAGTLIWIVAAVCALQTLGVNLRALVATLGIGTAAVALAAQDILKKIIGGITLFVDRPFKIGDHIKTAEAEGFVKRIGLRNTAIRTLDNRLVVLPNNKITDAAIENISQEPSRRVVLTLGLVYRTPPPKMQEALAILAALPKTQQGITPECTAAFSGYGASALEITFIYHIKKKYETQPLRIRSDVNMAVLQLFADAGLEFAYPTHTLIMEDAAKCGR